MFSGSYRPSDVIFLLKPRQKIERVDVKTKEILIQKGIKHYSEMLSPESLPSKQYLALFDQAFERNRERMAWDLLVLAAMINEKKQGPITLVSLARAGTPVGVVLKNILEMTFEREVTHYSVSIIRDRGIDTVAMDYIMENGHADESIVFIDGWTGKGVITQELKDSIAFYNFSRGVRVENDLWVLADLAGVTDFAATQDDYLIPSSILNATISGLISRSVLDEEIGDGDFHGCLYYADFEQEDRSQWFADAISLLACDMAKANALNIERAQATAIERIARGSDNKRKEEVQNLISRIMEEQGVTDINHVKPGIGEATRVLLRREPGLIMVNDNEQSKETRHIIVLAEEKGIPVINRKDLGPYQAIAIIKDMKKE